MPVQSNSMYNDPAIGQAFDNIASMFAAPKASDVYAYAKARQTADETKRLAEFYGMSRDPNTSRDVLDRAGIGAGRFTPNQSFYNVDQGNQTAVATNAADNQRALEQTKQNNQTDLTKFFNGDIKAGANDTIYTSPARQKVMGVGPQVRGNIVLSQGAQATLPGGEVITGQAPAAGKEQLSNYKDPNGRVGTAKFDATKGWVDSQNGEPLPQGSQTYSANLQGDKNSTGLGTTATNNAEGMIVDLTLARDTSKSLRNLLASNPGSQGLVGQIRGTVQDVLQTGNEVGQLMNVNMKKLQADIAAGRVDPAVAAKFNNFDPSIPAASMLETLLTAQVAKVLDPNGRVSNDRYEQVAKALGSGGWTSNQQRTMATLDQLDKIIDGRMKILAPAAPGAVKAMNPGAPAPMQPAPAAAPAPAPAPRQSFSNAIPGSVAPPGALPSPTAAPMRIIAPELGGPGSQPSRPAPAENWVRGPDGRLMRAP